MIDVALLSIIRRWHLRDQVSLREIARRLGVSRNTVRKYLRTDTTEPGTTFIAQELAKQDIVTTRAKTVIPDVTFKDAMDIDLGNHVVELRYHGPNDGRGSISVRVMPERVLFVVDWIVLGRMPWQKLWSYDIQGVINSTREVQNLDYDVFVGGHGTVGTKADVARYLRYMETLYAKVIDGSQEMLQQQFPEAVYRDIAGVCRVASLAEIEAQGWSLNPGRYVGVANTVQQDFDFVERLEALAEELEQLNQESEVLQANITANLPVLLGGA